MLSFGQLRNNLKRLQDVNKHMNIIVKIGWSRNALDQKQIKNQPIELYLRIIHYALIEYSTQLYKAILDMIPNIKALSDQKFVQSCFIIARKILNVNPKITPEQFLMPAKLIEKKIEFIVELCQNIQKWDSTNRKKGSKQVKYTNQLKNYIQQPTILKKPQDFDDDEDDDQLMQREITVKPTQFFEPLEHSFANNQDKKSSVMGKQTVSISSKPNVFPKNLQNQLSDDDEDNQRFAQTAKFNQQKPNQPQSNKNIKTKQINASRQKEIAQQSTEFVSKEQFNEVLEMLANINGTVNGLVSKFNNFQMNVTTWFNNTNARIVLLQQNVKMIKSNL